jgi:hypothetical protein
MVAGKKKPSGPKATKAKRKEYRASIVLNTTKAPYQVSGKFLAASKDYVRVLGETGDDIGKIIMVPQSMVKVIYLVEIS